MPSSNDAVLWRRAWACGALIVASQLAWPAASTAAPTPTPTPSPAVTATGTPAGEANSVAPAQGEKQEDTGDDGNARDAGETGDAGDTTEGVSGETGTNDQASDSADGGSLFSWFSFERLLLLAAVLSNGFLLSGIGWWFWRVGKDRQSLTEVVSQRLNVIATKLGAIEEAVRSGSVKTNSRPSPPQEPVPVPTVPILRGKSERVSAEDYESLLRETPPPPITRAAPQPTSPPRGRSAQPPVQSSAASLVAWYCQDRGSDVFDLQQRATDEGLEWGSPSGTRGQRHILNGPDQETTLLAIKDSRAEALYVVVGHEAQVTEAEWLDLFQVQTFPGKRLVRSRRPAVVNARTGEVEEKGELEVLGAS